MMAITMMITDDNNEDKDNENNSNDQAVQLHY